METCLRIIELGRGRDGPNERNIKVLDSTTGTDVRETDLLPANHHWRWHVAIEGGDGQCHHHHRLQLGLAAVAGAGAAAGSGVGTCLVIDTRNRDTRRGCSIERLQSGAEMY